VVRSFGSEFVADGGATAGVGLFAPGPLDSRRPAPARARRLPTSGSAAGLSLQGLHQRRDVRQGPELIVEVRAHGVVLHLGAHEAS
jgi:hypothetical protein